MTLLTGILFVLGLVLLIGGAELLVRGASALAGRFGISPLVIGLTVVAFGTSSPELAVSILSAWGGQPGIALGNVVGSNIANVLLILGLSALVAPLVVARQVIRMEVPLMISLSVGLLLLALDGVVGRFDGALLFGGVLIYTVWAIRRSRREASDAADADEPGGGPSSLTQQLVFIAVGLVLLGLGSNWLVDGAVAVAQTLGISDLVIGLTVIAVGTSLPELATSVLASMRGQRDIAVGNVVGSNIFNILAVLGLTSLVAPGGIPVAASALTFDLPVMTAVAIACLPIFFTGHVIARWEGAFFLLYYLAYTVYLILTATEHQALALFGEAMLFFVVPLTLVTLGISLWRGYRHPTRR